MLRRVSSLSTLISAAKPSLLNQVAYGLNFLEAFGAEALKPAEAGIVSKARTPTINFVLGGPGVGKGTQCTRIAETYGFTHLSVGDLLRKEISSNSEYGDMILETITKGKIVSSEVTVKLLKRTIDSGETDRFLIDGFPRSEENREAYERIIGIEPKVVLFFDCDEEEMVKRVLHRNQGRVNDNQVQHPFAVAYMRTCIGQHIVPAQQHQVHLYQMEMISLKRSETLVVGTTYLWLPACKSSI